MGRDWYSAVDDVSLSIPEPKTFMSKIIIFSLVITAQFTDIL